MSALKLFISHSSRLDDVEHKYSSRDRNWRLLEGTCKAIRQKFGDRVEVLVDKDGLVPGEDWNHRLNLWLAECHVAVVLFSRRAIENSDWVAKEAAILSWRAELDKDFTLIPVMLDGESTPEDLARDFLGVLKIDANQCIRNVKTAADILAGVVRKLGGPEDLAGTYPETPLERLQGGIAKLLADATSTASLLEALEAVDCQVSPGGTPNHERYADLLAQRFLTATPDQANACFNTFQLGIDPLAPRPALEHALGLFRQVRPLWVQPGAAACLPLALRHKQPLALSGRFITHADAYLKTQGYTLERYLERAWPGSSLYRCVTVPGRVEVTEVKDEIRRRFLGPAVPDFIDGAAKDRMINQDPKIIVLVVRIGSDIGGLPDPALLGDLQRLEEDYEKLVLIFAVESANDILPEILTAVEPKLDPDCEQMAYLAERSTKGFLDQKYGISQ
jgi:hypothetical protein